MSMGDSKELGTLIVVVGKARNLPNKSRFGKQDPFCTVKVGEEKQRTKAIKRGGQHPEWDEELRFTIMDDVDDVLVRSDSQPDTSLSSSTSNSGIADVQPGVTTAAALASKSRKGPITKKGVKSMRAACYADDAKEPELIGECVISIEDVLKKGEVDEWYEFLYKEKYSGEVYLELTFYSNNAPPVKRNVPRPPADAFSRHESLSSLAGQHRVSGGLSTSGSVSGMSLYIPPYVQPARAPSPIPQSSTPTSFAELGLPRKQSLPDPRMAHLSSSASTQTLSPHTSTSSLDVPTQPMASFSLGTTHASRPLPSVTPIPAYLGHAGTSHRHSVGGHHEAPWKSLLPQAERPPALTPHPRPMSSNDAIPWEQAQRVEEDRRTPAPRPVSGQGFGHPYRPDPRAPHIPASFISAAQPHEGYSDIFLPAGSAGTSGYLQHTPTPPPHASPGPLVGTTTSHYQMPTSSYSGIAQPQVESVRMPSPRPEYQRVTDPSQLLDSYRTSIASFESQNTRSPQHHEQNYDRPPSPNIQYVPQPFEAQQHPFPPPSHHTHTYPPFSKTPKNYQDAPPPHSTNSNLRQQLPTPRLSSPATSTNNGYVPWYQQTQSANQQPPSLSEQHYGQPNDHQHSQYAAQMPSGSSRRRVPHPPAPQRPQSVGYYPSDELYVQQRPLTPQIPSGHWREQRPQQPQGEGQDQYYYPPQTSTQPQPFSSDAHTVLPLTVPSPTPQHAANPTPPPHNAQDWQPGQQGYHRAPSPQPPLHRYYTPAPQHSRDPYPATSNLQLRPPSRAPSPQPPLNHTHSAPNGWQPQLILPEPSHPSQSNRPRRSLSPSPSARHDWRSYMQNLPAPSSASETPPRSPNPQPPPKDQQTWYTPPPSLPASIRPPEGWRSTLPAQANGHQWRG